MKLNWPAPERNKEPILQVLRRVLPAQGRLLEIASGTGQHAVHFAAALPGREFQPSDPDPANLASIAAWVEEVGLSNLRPPIPLDVCQDDWGVGTLQALYNANMIHIAPWACAEGLFAGAGRHLDAQGVFVLYGPFRIGGVHTADSNARFDEDLRGRDPSFGVRDLEAVVALAEQSGLALQERVAMPANNQCLVFRRPNG